MTVSPEPLDALFADLDARVRAWFADVRRRAAGGEPLALVQAMTPQEVFAAMDIPFVVNQWWASVVAEHGDSGAVLSRLAGLGYPQDRDQYHSLALASVLGDDPGPWGGLPDPTIVVTEDYYQRAKVAELWALERGAALFRLGFTVQNEVPLEWWNRLAHEWDTLLDPARLDLMESELENLVRFLEQTTGRTFRESDFERVLQRVNAQEELNRCSRDLIARTVPAPVGMFDTAAFVMRHQWWRGSEWALDAAQRFCQEVERRVAAGEAVCDGERVRLMWLGPPPWFAVELFSHLEREHGAVFVWSNYLSIAADGYPRYGGRPMRRLAARFVPFHDQLTMPPWNTGWYAHQAVTHSADGAISVGGVGGRYGSWFAERALAAAGVPLLQLDANNADPRTWDEAAITRTVAEFVERRAAPVAGRRHGRHVAEA